MKFCQSGEISPNLVTLLTANNFLVLPNKKASNGEWLCALSLEKLCEAHSRCRCTYALPLENFPLSQSENLHEFEIQKVLPPADATDTDETKGPFVGLEMLKHRLQLILNNSNISSSHSNSALATNAVILSNAFS